MYNNKLAENESVGGRNGFAMEVTNDKGYCVYLPFTRIGSMLVQRGYPLKQIQLLSWVCHVVRTHDDMIILSTLPRILMDGKRKYRFFQNYPDILAREDCFITGNTFLFP
jgi:hypothetical protein